MDVKDYQRLAMAKEADQAAIRDWVYSQGILATRLNNAARGLADDAGEVNGCIKKWLEYQQPLDEVNLLEEVGDCLWRLTQICQALGWTLEDVMAANLRKLNVRYEVRCNPTEAAEENRDRNAERRAIAGENEPLVVLDEIPVSFGDGLRRRVEDDGVIYDGPGAATRSDLRRTALCGSCSAPISDEVVRKLGDPNYRTKVFLCPECQQPLTFLGLRYA